MGRFGDAASGPTLIVLGAVHGNEPSGYKAMLSLFSRFVETPVKLRGSMVGLVGNRQALTESVRFCEEDLNRLWLPDRVARIRVAENLSGEMAEARDLYLEIERVLTESDGPVYALDIHSTSGAGPSFVVLDDSLPNREFALELEVPMVLGIEEELEGTLLDYLNARGVRTAGFEAGQHDDPESVERAEAAIWVAMRASGVLGRNCEADVDRASRRLAASGRGLPHLFEVRHRHAIRPNLVFQMHPGLKGFQAIAEGEELAIESGASVRAPQAGLLLMPLYQAQGEDGYFVIRPVKTRWLGISARLRQLRLERVVHWLPGVRRLDAVGREIRVDVRIARWLPLDFFHLLGFRRIGQVGRHLFLRRRPDDGVEAASAEWPPV
ncbi:MAG: hypothetical protein GY769_16370 [bacterium]|nr:hypothetical protein [bacterium]